MNRFAKGLFRGLLPLWVGLAFLGGNAKADQFRWAGAFVHESMEPHHNIPQNLYLLQNIYEGLTYNDSSGKIIPLLATKWEQVEPTRWRFTLRQGVKFHNGEAFTADDVIFTFQRAHSKNATMEYALNRVKSVDKVDDFTIDITTDGPNVLLPANLATLSIMSKVWCIANNATEPYDRTGKVENYAVRHEDGTGPFMLASWDPGQSVDLKVNPNWWGGKRTDKMDTAKYTSISSPTTLVSALQANEVDMIIGVSPTITDRLEKLPGIKIFKGRHTQTMIVSYDLFRDELLESSVKGKNPFKDKRVRRAIYLAIDVPSIIDKIMNGYGFPTDLLVGRDVAQVNDQLNVRQPFNLEKAKQLMVEAGYPDGFEVTFDCPSGQYVRDEAICLAIASMLAKINIKANTNILQGIAFSTKIGRAGGYKSSFFLNSHTQSAFDSANIFSNYLITRDDKAGTGAANIPGWSNPEFDALVQKILNETDMAKRQQLIEDGWRIVKEELPDIALFQQAVVWVAKDNITPILDPIGRVLLTNIKMN